MLIKPNLLTSGSANISRRSAITGVAAGLTGVLLNSRLMGQAKARSALDPSIFVVYAKPDTGLFNADVYGNPTTQIPGYILACPQSCAKSRAGYREASTNSALKSVYLNTTEWMREIIFTDDYKDVVDPATLRQNFSKYRKLLGFARVSNDPSAGGCGYISRNVEVTKVNLDTQSGLLKETSLPGLYSSLANGTIQDPVYPADTIYIYPGDWQQQNGSPISTAIGEIGGDARPIDVTGCEP